MTKKTIGTPIRRKEGREKVTGTRQYIDDIELPEHLFGATVRSKVARGKLKDLSFPPGVDWNEFTIVTARDVDHNIVALILDDQPYLATDMINHPDEAIVLLAHPDPETLRRAVELVNVEVDPLPSVHDITTSLEQETIIWGKDNIQKTIRIEKGNVDSIWDSAAHIIEGEYETGAQEQLYIEPHGVVADFSDDHVTVWGSLQCPYYVHSALTSLFGLPGEKVRIVQIETGGGFGGKEDYPSVLAGHAALLSRKAKMPVKMIYDRHEDMRATTKRHPSRTRHKTAIDADGKILAIDIDFVLDGGAYATLSSVVLSRGAIHAAGPYDCPNVRINSRVAATNTPPHGAFRGFGAPQSLFAAERHMDKCAQKLGLTPAEFRKRNFLRKGGITATSQTIRDEIDMHALLDDALKKSDYQTKHDRYAKENPTSQIKRGIGFASFYHGAGFTGGGEKALASIAAVELNDDGKIEVLSSSTEIGQGTNTIFSQIACDTLEIDYDDIVVARPDTARVPNSGPTVASRTVMVVGKLVEQASKNLLNKLQTANLLGGTYSRDEFFNATRLYKEKHGSLRGEAQYVQPEFIEWDDATYQGDAYATFAWAVYVADVSIDPITYTVTVNDFVALQDVGDVIHPVFAEGQIEGGVAQGIGYSIYEKCVWDNGQLANPNFTNYIMPSAGDLPPIRVFFTPSQSPHGPGKGAKGIGELPLDGVGPAIANAVSMALKTDADYIPLLPEDVFSLLQKENRV